jgi:hypothetical protein
MGGFVESVTSEWSTTFSAWRVLDGVPSTIWASLAAKFPQELVLSFPGRDRALVSGVVVTLPARNAEPARKSDEAEGVGAALARDLEIWTSLDSPSAGFTRVAAASLPAEPGDHRIDFPAPVEARFVKIAILSNHGAQLSVVLGDIAVHEGQRASYTALGARHGDLADLHRTGSLQAPEGGATPVAAASAASFSASACAPAGPPAATPQHSESRNVLVVADQRFTYSPFDYLPDPGKPPYFRPGSTPKYFDPSIYGRLLVRHVLAEAANPALLVPSAGIDTVVLSQVCDPGKQLSLPFKRTLVDWVARGHKLIIQDSDQCGSHKQPDYGFLPYPLVTSNPGAKGASSSVLEILEGNTLVNPDPSSPAFLDAASWRSGYNDLGDSNTMVRYDPHWCGVLLTTNANNVAGFAFAYAHHGRGLIIYDGVDFDQRANVSYQQLATRELVQPFDPDGLPCRTRISDFVVTTDPALHTRQVTPGQRYTYPLTVWANQSHQGTVTLDPFTTAPVAGLEMTIEPKTVTLGNKAAATLTVTMPPTLPAFLSFGVRAGSDDGAGTLCLTATERRTGSLRVVSDVQAAAEPIRKNLEIILDLSGSMKQRLGNSTRIDTARRVLRQVLEKIPGDVRVGLRVYGRRYGSKQRETCTDSELVVPVTAPDRKRIVDFVDHANPRGETPLVYSLLQTIGDLKPAGGGTVILITDGEESCGGSFAEAAQRLKASGLEVSLSIVGFTLAGRQAQKQLADVASATGGLYYSADDAATLAQAVTSAAVSRFPYTIFTSAGQALASGEAGDVGSELAPGEYRVVVRAADQEVTVEKVTVTPGASVVLRIVRRAGTFAIEPR